MTLRKPEGAVPIKDMDSFMLGWNSALGQAVKMITYEMSFDKGCKDLFSKGCVKAQENILRRIEKIKP